MYERRLQSEYPTSFIFVVDQSSSMAEPFGHGTAPKSAAVADALNRLMQNLIDAATKEEVRHYYDFAVVGYGLTVGSLLHGSKPGNEFVPVQVVADNPLRVLDRTRRVPDGVGGLVEEKVKMAVWVEPAANGGTPMYAAFEQVLALADKAARRYPNSYPPTVIHITDGEFTDQDPSPLMEQLKRISTSDGNVLLFNIHISSNPGSIFLPDAETGLPDQYSRMLFRTSSVLPPQCREAARLEGLVVSEQSRGFAFNANPAMLVQFFNIGTGTMANRLLLPAGNVER
jgi:hypothetical protein